MPTSRVRRDSAAMSRAPVFAALGDPTRLAILTDLSAGHERSISTLTRGSNLTRQAVAKHLRVLGDVGLVRATSRGRERLYRLRPAPLHDARRALDSIAGQWEDALNRLKTFAEK